MISSAVSLFLLRGLPLSRFDYPRWHSVLAMTLLGVLTGLDPRLFNEPGIIVLPMWFGVTVSVLSEWACFLVIFVILHWWMKRGGRWDGQGDLFNLVAASWLVCDMLCGGLVALGVPVSFTVPLWPYSLWVGAVALSGGIPKASRGYCLGGIALGLIPAGLATIAVLFAFGIFLAMLGVAPPGSPAA